MNTMSTGISAPAPSASPLVTVGHHLFDWAGRTGRLTCRGWGRPDKLQCLCGSRHQRIWYEDQPSGCWFYLCEIVERVVVKHNDAQQQASYQEWEIEDFIRWLCP